MNDARPLIAFAIPELAAGGPDRVLFELLCHLPRARFRLALIVTDAGGRYWDRLPADVARIAIGGGRYPIRRLAAVLRRLRPALLFTTLRMNLTAPFALALVRRRPIHVARQANAIASDFAQLKRQTRLKHRLAERVTRHALRRADGVVAQARDMADELAGFLRPSQRLVTIGNPIDSDALIAEAAAHPAPPPPGRPALVAVGRLMPQKGFDVLVRALALLRATHPAAELTLIGEGPQRAELAALAATLGLAAAVHLPGRSDTVAATVAAADLFVSASRYEGFPNVVLEAMAVGTPVVATACPGGTRELVIDGVTGWLAVPEDPAALAAAIARALAGDRAGIVAAARAHVADRFSRAAVIASYSELFAAMLAAAR